jgi:hypothetical protein
MKIAIPKKHPRGPKKKRVKIPPPTRLLFGHGIIVGEKEDTIGLVINPTEGTVEAHAVNNKVLKAHFDAARAMRKWPANAEVTEPVFLKAVETAMAVKVGGFLSGLVAKTRPKAAAATTASVPPAAPIHSASPEQKAIPVPAEIEVQQSAVKSAANAKVR